MKDVTAPPRPRRSQLVLGIFEWWDLGWSRAWPIFVIAGGLGLILQRHDDEGGRHPRMPGNGDS